MVANARKKHVLSLGVPTGRHQPLHVQFVYGANKKASVSVKWSERKDRLIFTTSNEDYPKIFFRYVNADGLLVEEMHVLDKKSGKPMTGSLIQFFKKQ
mmetsp:Transcript_4684/g.8433  ORF Transcript_4684/g.8433 Transcript_4684/m.8433 type:complete len:98 (+) Transcript_4684:459-752(+)